MASRKSLLPFQRFAQEWKDKITRREQEDLELSSHFADQRVAKEEILASKISKLDQSKEIEAQVTAKIESAVKRFEEAIKALREAHDEEVEAIDRWEEEEIEENERRIREGKKGLEEAEKERDEEWESMREKLRGLRNREDEEARRRSMVLLEEEGMRLGGFTPDRVLEPSVITSVTTRRTDSQRQTRRKSTKNLGRRPKSLDGAQIQATRPAVLTPSSSPSQQLHQDIDSGVDELQDEKQLTNLNPRKRHRLEDLPPLKSNSSRFSKTPRKLKTFDLHVRQSVETSAFNSVSDEERLL